MLCVKIPGAQRVLKYSKQPIWYKHPWSKKLHYFPFLMFYVNINWTTCIILCIVLLPLGWLIGKRHKWAAVQLFSGRVDSECTCNDAISKGPESIYLCQTEQEKRREGKNRDKAVWGLSGQSVCNNFCFPHFSFMRQTVFLMFKYHKRWEHGSLQSTNGSGLNWIEHKWIIAL